MWINFNIDLLYNNNLLSFIKKILQSNVFFFSGDNVVQQIVTSLTKHYSSISSNIISPSVSIFKIFTQGSEWKRYCN